MNWLRRISFVAALLASTSLALAQSPGAGQGVPNTGGGGGGGGGGSGTVTSIATACGVAGGPITTTGTIAGAIPINAQTGTTYTPSPAASPVPDCGDLITFTNASPIAVTLSNSNYAASNNFNAIVLPLSGGSATFTPTSGTINGLASITLAPGSPGGTFLFDGANWEFGGSGVNLGNAGLDVTAGYVATNSYLPLPNRASPGTGLVGAAQTVYCTYAYVGQTLTVTKLGIEIPTTVGTSDVNLAIYSDVNGRPGTLLQSTGQFVNTSTGFDNGTLIASFQFQKGVPYFLCQMTGDATMVMNGYPSAAGMGAELGAVAGSEVSLFANAAGILGLSCSAACNGGTPTTLVFPTNLAGSTWTNVITARAPAISFTVSSVP